MWKKNVFIVFFFVGSQVIKITTLRTSWLIPYYLFQRSSWTRSPVRYSSATKIVCGSFDRSDSEMRRFPKMTFYEQVRILYDNIRAENTVFENYYKKSQLSSWALEYWSWVSFGVKICYLCVMSILFISYTLTITEGQQKKLLTVNGKLKYVYLTVIRPGERFRWWLLWEIQFW